MAWGRLGFEAIKPALPGGIQRSLHLHASEPDCGTDYRPLPHTWVDPPYRFREALSEAIQ